MKKVIDASYVREVNQKIILHAMYRMGSTSRSNLSKGLNLSKPSVSDHLSPLINMGIIKEVGEGMTAHRGGRKPMMLDFNEKYCYIMAIDLNYKAPIFVLSNLKNEILREFEIKVTSNTDDATQLSIIEESIRLLINASGITMEQVYCIAVACPGVFNGNGEFVSRNTHFTGLDWSKFDFINHFKSVFGIKTIVMNDINAATLGQWSMDGNEQINNFLFLSCGKGLGAGLILNGSLYEGATYSVGEIFNYTDFARVNKGTTIEEEICLKALVNRCTIAIKSGEKTNIQITDTGLLSFDMILKAYFEKDPLVYHILTEICDELCAIVCNYINFLPVEKVVLGGDYSVFGDLFMSRFKTKFVKYCNSMPEIAVASIKKYSGIYGLLLCARNSLFNYICEAR